MPMPQFPHDRWRVLSPYLDQALDVPPDARGAWLASLRAVDGPLARDLGAMLEEHAAVDESGFLDGMALDAQLREPRLSPGSRSGPIGSCRSSDRAAAGACGAPIGAMAASRGRRQSSCSIWRS